MRKILSVVLAVLMVSMIIPTMSFAAYEDITGLVAGETFTVTPTSAVTVSVNTQVFDIVDGTVAEDGKTESIAATANTAVTIQVKTSIPKEFTSQVKVGDEFVNVSVKDRLLGDANGDGAVNAADATQVLLAYASLDTDATYKGEAANANLDTTVNAADATQILLAYAALDTDVEGLGTIYIGGDADVKVEDPWTAEPATTPLAKPEGVYAYHQNGIVYFTFDAVANATSYEVTVGNASTTVEATSGSVEAAYVDGLAISVVAKSTDTAYTDSEAGTANVVDATVSGELATWLSQNGLSDVAITVYEITE